MTQPMNALAQTALKFAIQALPQMQVLQTIIDDGKNIAVFSKEDLIKRLALELKQYELDLERNQLRHSCTAKFVNHFCTELES